MRNNKEFAGRPPCLLDLVEAFTGRTEVPIRDTQTGQVLTVREDNVWSDGKIVGYDEGGFPKVIDLGKYEIV